MVDAGGPRHVDAAMDRVDPGGAAEGHHHAGRAQDGQPTDNAEAPVEGLLRQKLTAGDGDRDRDVRRGPGSGCDLRHRFPHHLPRHRIDGWLAWRDLQAGTGDGANSGPGVEGNAGTGRVGTDRGAHEAAMGDVGVVAGVLDDRGHGKVSGQLTLGQREGGAAAAGQADGDRIGEAQPGQCAECRLDGGRGAGTGGPAAAQLTRRAPRPSLAIARSRSGA